MNLDHYSRTRPALAVLASNIVEDLTEALAPFEGRAGVHARVMDMAGMAAALELPWNAAAEDVSEQLTVTVVAAHDPMPDVLALIEASYRVLEVAERPAGAEAKRRTALRCLIPAVLAPRDWHDGESRPQTFLVEVMAA